MMTDPNLLQLWGKIAEFCEVQCGAMYMVDSVEDAMEDNVNALACCNSVNRGEMRLIAGDFQGNVVLYDSDYAIVAQLKPHSNMVTTISPVSKPPTWPPAPWTAPCASSTWRPTASCSQ